MKTELPVWAPWGKVELHKAAISHTKINVPLVSFIKQIGIPRAAQVFSTSFITSSQIVIAISPIPELCTNSGFDQWNLAGECQLLTDAIFWRINNIGKTPVMRNNKVMHSCCALKKEIKRLGKTLA